MSSTSHVQRLQERELISPPHWLPSTTMFEGLTGSHAYGCAENADSDYDVYGFCVPPKHILFPHLSGHILGFGTKPQTFDQYQQHHVDDPGTRRTYDLVIYNIVRFFELCRANNPNMIDALFLPRRCVLHSTQIYEHVRENRRLFLSTNCANTFRGYAFAQLKKLTHHKGAQAKTSKRRQESVDKYGYDTKFAYHIVRLALECEQILTTGNLDLERDRETYKSIRRGEWSIKRIQTWFDTMERSLIDHKAESDLPYDPDEEALRAVLIECLEMHYGSLAKAVVDTTRHERMVNELDALVARYR